VTAKVQIKDATGKKAGEVTLADAIFGIEPNMAAMHQVVRSQRAAQRAGSADTKTRGEIRGGGAKPWRQKGTGRARAGTNRSPLWRGGGVVFGPHPRDYSFAVPKKVKRLALLSALSAKARDGKVVVVKAFASDKPSTKAAAALLAAAGIDAKATIVLANDDIAGAKSVRNLAGARPIAVNQINPYDVLDNEYLVFTKAAIESLQEVYAR
jgi:large subunit ribosomal protein L4